VCPRMAARTHLTQMGSPLRTGMRPDGPSAHRQAGTRSATALPIARILRRMVAANLARISHRQPWSVASTAPSSRTARPQTPVAIRVPTAVSAWLGMEPVTQRATRVFFARRTIWACSSPRTAERIGSAIWTWVCGRATHCPSREHARPSQGSASAAAIAAFAPKAKPAQDDRLCIPTVSAPLEVVERALLPERPPTWFLMAAAAAARVV
jgi:hypothetical protein